jgi:hypothetical protein
MGLYTEHPEVIVTGLATGTIAKYRFIGFDDAIIGTRGEVAKGVSRDSGDIGKSFPITTAGTALVEMAEDVAAGDDITSDDEGKGVKAYDGDAVNGIVVRGQVAGGIAEIMLKAAAPVSTETSTSTTSTSTTTTTTTST